MAKQESVEFPKGADWLQSLNDQVLVDMLNDLMHELEKRGKVDLLESSRQKRAGIQREQTSPGPMPSFTLPSRHTYIFRYRIPFWALFAGYLPHVLA